MRLNKRDHRSLTLWAAKCAEHVLPLFEQEFDGDQRPRKAIEAARACARGKLAASEARAAALAAHAAARDADHVVARAAARSAGHAAATAHTPDHAPHVATYALTAVANGAGSRHAEAAKANEREWQLERLLGRLRPLVLPERDGE
jgi:hypothetical protein